MQLRRIAAAVAVGLLATAGFATGAAAAAPSNKPLVTASVGSLSGAAAPVTYNVNRGAQQIASVTYFLNGGEPLAAPAPTAATKRSSGGSFTVTAVDGLNTLTVTVNLTDGGTDTSNEVTFTADAYSAARAGCEAFTEGVFTVGDDPGTARTERLYCYTADLFSDDYYAKVFKDACFAAGGVNWIGSATFEPPVSYYTCE
jgi:hypothetical protein